MLMFQTLLKIRINNWKLSTKVILSLIYNFIEFFYDSNVFLAKKTPYQLTEKSSIIIYANLGMSIHAMVNIKYFVDFLQNVSKFLSKFAFF